ncbi:MAG: recombination mediator RecR [Ignavibacteria bacterium]|nr:recombination protein RecR [Ignavibacteria bacterium]MBK7158300.1 recombination protein RecR [Ignavibacteria bacterium]MBK7254307.1 recombination protein RecR [Ignavibacteria bacterium]MBK7446472.1 recombination protein RecR [Ignavibacteria bacterium]MBK8380399.1 recombination protein RecR [Ignavibacteria bacterium]
MVSTSDALDSLIEEFSKLPQIGRKTAQRLAMYITRQPREEVEKFSRALLETKDKLKFCSVCCNITEDEVCRICSSSKRSSNVICVVEEPQDVFAVEKTNEFKGLYHVLHGIISPLDGIGPNDIKISELLIRLGKENGQRVEELILALNPTVEGETTILYLSKLLRPLDIKITRIARGIPIGSDLEFADEVTLAKALEGRVTV